MYLIVYLLECKRFKHELNILQSSQECYRFSNWYVMSSCWRKIYIVEYFHNVYAEEFYFMVYAPKICTNIYSQKQSALIGLMQYKEIPGLCLKSGYILTLIKF